MGCTTEKYSWPSGVNVANFVTVKPDLENEEERSMNFKLWKKQMVCLVESQDVLGFINGEIVEPLYQKKLWRRSDRLVQGWILGSIGKDLLRKVCELETAREVWLELHKICNDNEAADSEADSEILLPDSETQPGEESASQVSTDFSTYLPLYNAALSGDWKTAHELFFKNKSEETEAFITENEETALHVAVRNKGANVFVRNLVEMMSPEALAIKNSKGETALHEAAIVGNTKAAKLMVEKAMHVKNPDLVYMLANEYDENSMALDFAAENGHKEALEYLISVSNRDSPFEGQRGRSLFFTIITWQFMDVALNLVKKYPDLARLTDPEGNNCALSVLAGMDSAFESSKSFSWWEKLIYRCVPVNQSESGPTSIAGDVEAITNRSSFSIINKAEKWCKSMTDCCTAEKWCKSMIWKVMECIGMKDIKNKKKLNSQAQELVEYLCRGMTSLPTEDARIMFQDSIMVAAEYGVREIVKIIMEMYPALTTCVNDEGWTIMHVAVRWRFENVFNLIHKMIDGNHKSFNLLDEKGNSLLHLCAMLPNPERLNDVPGAALQMQRELQWFNEMEKFVPHSCILVRNNDGKTAKELFTEEHEELKAEGERWMKSTANACSIATALIATVVFAASFTVPGGVSSETGIPVFFHEPAFVLFATTNAVSLFTSITSLLLFLSILTSRYAEQDFLHILPNRLRFGLLTLFISITFMLVAFSAALYLLFLPKLVWFIVPVTAFGWLPVASFVQLQFPLILDVIYSTYGPSILSKN